MASYIDAITQFNPYVSQLPVDLMAKVGMQKQAQYEQGLQKVQSQIDSVAGMDVMKDLHKNYLQSKLNELGGNLKAYAASDFSNFQLVNSVGGMAKQIGRDPIIQGAVSSTAWARKQQANMETAKKANKSSIQNEEWFNNGLSKWLNDGNIKSAYTDEYVNYTDIDAKLRTVVEKMHEEDKSIENPWKRDAAGNTLYYDKNGNASLDPSKGQKVVDDAMLKLTIKGKPAEKILSNFYSSLNENDQRQLKIDGWYHYKGATEDTFKKDIVNNYNKSKQILTDGIVDMNVSLANPKLSTADKAALQANLSVANKKLTDGSLEASLQSDLSGISKITDLDDYKYRLYSQKTLTKLATDLSWQSYQQEFINNPYAQMGLEKSKLQATIDQNAITNAHWNETHRLDIEKFKWQKTVDTANIQSKLLESQGSEPITEKAPTPTGVDRPTAQTLNTKIEAGKIEITSLTNDYISKHRPANYANLTPAQQKESDRIQAETLNKQAAIFDQNPDKIDLTGNNNLRQYLESRRSKDRNLLANGVVLNNMTSASKVFDDKLDKALAGEQGVKFTNGSQLYSAKELFEVNSVYKNYFTTVSSGGSRSDTPVTALDSKGFLSRYRGTKYEPIAIALVKKYSGGQLTQTENGIVSTSTRLSQKYAPVNAQLVRDKLEFQSDYLAQRMPEYQSTIGTLDKDNKGDMRNIERLIGNSTYIYNSIGALDVDKKNMFSPGTINGWQQNSKVAATLKYNLEKNEFDGSGKLHIINGSEEQIIPLNVQQMNNYFPRYSQLNPVSGIKAQIIKMGGTTNIAGKIDPVNSYLTGASIPLVSNTPFAKLVRLDFEAADGNDGSEFDGYQARLYVYDETNGIWKDKVVNQSGFISEDNIQTMINGIGMNAIEDVLKSK